MKSLILLSSILLPLAAHADGYGWKGQCKSADGRVVVQVLPWDDDGKVIVTLGGRKVYEGIAIVSTFDPNAASVSWTDEDKTKMKLTVRFSETLPESTGKLVLGGRELQGLSCNVRSVDEE